MTNLPPQDLEREIARSRSFTSDCVFTLVLYFILFIPGAIANYLFLKEAEKAEKLAGVPLPGVAGLRLMWALLLAACGLIFAACALVFFVALMRGFR